MTTKSITPGQQKQAIRFLEEAGTDVLKDLNLSKDDAQRLLERGGEFKKELAALLAPMIQRFSLASNILVVPNLSPSELIERAQREVKLTYLFEGLATWDFSKAQDGEPIDYRGKRYEVLTWKPGRDVSTEEVRAHFKEQNADGNTAAFIAWVTEHKPKGYHTSIPSDDKLLWRDPESGDLYAPDFRHDGGNRELSLCGVRNDWCDGWVFVAFRELPSVTSHE